MRELRSARALQVHETEEMTKVAESLWGKGAAALSAAATDVDDLEGAEGSAERGILEQENGAARGSLSVAEHMVQAMDMVDKSSRGMLRAAEKSWQQQAAANDAAQNATIDS